MAEERMASVEMVCKGSSGSGYDFLREGLRCFLQELMEQEVTTLVGAERYERSDERTNQRNAGRHRTLNTRLGTVDLAIPKLRTGSYFPGWFEPRRRSERALVSVVAEAYLLSHAGVTVE